MMIKVGKRLILTLIISPECLVLLIGWGIWEYAREQLNSVAAALPSNGEMIRYLALLPVGLFVWLLKEGKDILFPGDSEENKRLVQWPDYWRLKLTFGVAVIYGFLFAVASVLVWVLGWKVNEARGFGLLTLSLVGALTVSGTVYFAKIKEKEILMKFLE